MEPGVHDTFLHTLSDMQTLVKLDLSLSSSATELGISGLSQLTNLQSLKLPVSKHKAGVSERAVNAFKNLTKLTFLLLNGWPITEYSIISITSLTKLQHIDVSDCERLTCLCFMPLLQFPCLHTVEIRRSDEWLIEAVFVVFQLLRPAVALYFW